MKVIIQIPCYNEAETLTQVVEDFPRTLPGIDCVEYLVIDDGSHDQTIAVAKKLGVHHVVRHKLNRGLAATFATGLKTCLALNADIIVNTDGDHQYPGRYISDLVEPIVAGRADLVIGDRRPGSDRKFSPLKRALQRFGGAVVSWMAGRHIPDPVSGFRAMSREAAIQTHILTGYSYTIESLLQAVHRGLFIEFVAIETNQATRKSRLMRSLPHFIGRTGATLLRVFFMFHPLNVLVWSSGILGFIGLLPIIRFLILAATGDGAGHLQSLILGAALVVLAAMVLVAGLIADLISHNRKLIEFAIENDIQFARIRKGDTSND